MRGRAAFVYSASADAYRPSVDGTLLPAVTDQTFVENHNFYTRPALDGAISFDSFE